MTENERIMKRVLFGVGTAFCLVVAVVLFFFDPTKVPIYPPCIFHRVTGLNCPGCGTLRALHALLHGQLWTALHFNAFLVLSLPVFAWIGFRFLRHEITGAPAKVVRVSWLWWYLGLWLTFAIVRELPIPFLASWSP